MSGSRLLHVFPFTSAVFLFAYLSASLFLSVCLSLCLSLSMSLSVCICLFLCLCLSRAGGLSSCMSVLLAVHVSVYVWLRLSAFSSAYPFVCLSVCLSVAWRWTYFGRFRFDELVVMVTRVNPSIFDDDFNGQPEVRETEVMDRMVSATTRKQPHDQSSRTILVSIPRFISPSLCLCLSLSHGVCMCVHV